MTNPILLFNSEFTCIIGFFLLKKEICGDSLGFLGLMSGILIVITGGLGIYKSIKDNLRNDSDKT